MHTTIHMFVGPPVVEGRVLGNKVCLSFCPSVCPGVFLELDHLIFLNFSIVLDTLIKLCMTEPNFLEKLFLIQTLGKCAKNRPKIGFYEFKEKFGH